MLLPFFVQNFGAPGHRFAIHIHDWIWVGSKGLVLDFKGGMQKLRIESLEQSGLWGGTEAGMSRERMRAHRERGGIGRAEKDFSCSAEQSRALAFPPRSTRHTHISKITGTTSAPLQRPRTRLRRCNARSTKALQRIDRIDLTDDDTTHSQSQLLRFFGAA